VEPFEIGRLAIGAFAVIGVALFVDATLGICVVALRLMAVELRCHFDNLMDEHQLVL
jgi:hypothetical protein